MLFTKKIAKMRDVVMARGVIAGTIERDRQGVRYFEIRDPEGNEIEVVEDQWEPFPPSVRGHGHGARHCGKCVRDDWRFRRSLHPLEHFGQGLPHRYFSGANQFAGAFEIVVGEADNVGFHDHVCGASPEMAHLVLGDGEGLANHVKQMAGCAIF
jgi:hypothetical protein